MSTSSQDDLDEQLSRFEKLLPNFAARTVSWLRQPSSKWVRIPAGIFLICAGIVGTFLPILGFWMIPLGLALIAHDVPFLRRPLARLLGWIDRKWLSKRTAKKSAKSPKSARSAKSAKSDAN